MAKARKKADDTSPAETSPAEDTSFNPAEFDPAIQVKADEIVHGLAESTRIEPDAPRHAPAEAPAGEASHAAKFQKPKPGYTAAGQFDPVIGARHREYQDKDNAIYLSIIKLDEKPSAAVTGLLRDAGFKWEAQAKEWSRPVRYESRQQDRYTAERTYAEVCKMVRQERGIGHEFGGAA